ncbi:MAG: transcription termination factor NusA [Candidatus Magasanikbacteria bacterium]
MQSEISKQIKVICQEKDVDEETVLSAIEKALASAYRKDFGEGDQNIKFNFDPETGDMEAWDEKEVVEDMDEEELEWSREEFKRRREEARKEDRELTEEELEDLVHFNDKEQIMISEAKEIDEDVEVGDTLKIPLEIPGEFGRMAAQTAKQVIIQKLKEAERENVYEQFKEKENTIIEGVIQSVKDSGNVLVDLDKINGFLPQKEQNPNDDYQPGKRLIFYIKSVEKGSKGPEILLSRSSKEMVRLIFEREIPEIETGEVELKSVAREAGSRSKVSVWTDDDSIDPIGSCIGRRGSRITTIIDELGGEKVDVIEYSEDPSEYIKNALSPADVDKVEISEYGKEATAIVEDDQFSLAIGKNGQNVRLAAELTGWVINVVEKGEETEVSSADDTDDLNEEVDIEVEEDQEDESGEKEEADEPEDNKQKEESVEQDENSEESEEESGDDGSEETKEEVEESEDEQKE